MDYYDGNTVTGLWNLAQHFTLNDNSYDTQFGPSPPGAINVISGDTNGAVAEGGASTQHRQRHAERRRRAAISTSAPTPARAVRTTLPGSGALPGRCHGRADRQEHRRPAQPQEPHLGLVPGRLHPVVEFSSTGRPICGATDATRPHRDNVGRVGATTRAPRAVPVLQSHLEPRPPVAGQRRAGRRPDAAEQAVNHQYDLTWFNKALAAGDMPAVSYLKAPEYEDGHAGYSDPLDEQRFIVDEINQIEQSPDWASTAIFIAYDDSDGWYDHQMGPIIRGSQDAADTLNGAGQVRLDARPRTPTTQRPLRRRSAAAAAGHLAVGEAELRRQHVHRAGLDPEVHRGQLEPRPDRRRVRRRGGGNARPTRSTSTRATATRRRSSSTRTRARSPRRSRRRRRPRRLGLELVELDHARAVRPRIGRADRLRWRFGQGGGGQTVDGQAPEGDLQGQGRPAEADPDLHDQGR